MTRCLTLNKTVIKCHCLSGPALFKSIALCKYLVLSIIYHSADLGIICKSSANLTVMSTGLWCSHFYMQTPWTLQVLEGVHILGTADRMGQQVPSQAITILIKSYTLDAQVTKAVYNILEIISLSPFMMSTAKSVAEYQAMLSNCDFFFNVCYKNLAILLPCKYLYSLNL